MLGCGSAGHRPLVEVDQGIPRIAEDQCWLQAAHLVFVGYICIPEHHVIWLATMVAQKQNTPADIAR